MGAVASIQITLQRMRFHAHVGILPHERDAPQPIEVDLTVVVTEGSGVVDYAKLYDGVSGILSAGAIDFLEQVGERVIEESFAVSERIRSVRVAVRKPHVSLGGPLDYAEVMMSQTLDDDPEHTETSSG